MQRSNRALSRLETGVCFGIVVGSVALGSFVAASAIVAGGCVIAPWLLVARIVGWV